MEVMNQDSSQENYIDNNESSGQDEECDKNILCIIWKNSKMGAAYYNPYEKILYIYDEIIDLAPQFLVCRTLYREINPCYVITFGSRADDFVATLVNTITGQDDTTSVSDSVKMLPKDLSLLSLKEYSYEICKTVLSQVTLAGITSEMPESKKLLYIQSLINFDYKLSIHATGALVKYLEKNWGYFSPSKEDLQFLYVHQVSIKKHVLMDCTSFSAFQIFNQRSHESSFKRGMQSSSREGVSIYRLFSSNCKSKIGQHYLKNTLLNPIKDMEELNKRLDFIQFVLNPSNKEFIEGLQDNIKELLDVHKVLFKVQNTKATGREWAMLYKTIHRTIFINELATPYREESKILEELNCSISLDLISLEQTINSALDFSSNKRTRRPVIKFGLDENLDAKLLRRQDISKHVTAAARIAIEKLPEFLDECSVIYLPEMGHLICVKEWEPNCDPEALQHLDFQFVFSLRGMHHYKNPMCVELDKHLGDINSEIIAHENRIIQRLSGFVLKYNNDIRKPLKVIALIDSLISMATVAHNHSYVRPVLNDESYHKILEGRHPLMELTQHFEPNDFISGKESSHMKIITGPNGSGKSIYLKQVGLIIYLAHIGSYVPAKEAVIGMVDSIHSRMQAAESASIRLSAFMIDISLATQALQNATSSSLIIMDEFGRGTLDDDALTILTVALKSFLDRNNSCPHVLVSTHFQRITQLLPKTPLVQHMKMSHIVKDEDFLFLYKIAEGVSRSFAFEIAPQADLDEDIVARAREIYQCLSDPNSQMLQPLPQKRNYPTTSDADESLLYNINIPEPDD